MTMDDWLEANNRYLEASLRWLRLRLRRLIPEEPAPVIALPPSAAITDAPAAPSRGRFSRWRKGAGASEVRQEQPRLLVEGKPPSLDEQIEKAARERESAAQIEPPPALVILARQWGLSEFERDALLLCAAVEFDSEFSTLYGLAQDNARNYP